MLPAFFLLLQPAGAWEVVAFRVVCSLVVCVVLLLVTNGWRRLWAVIRTPRLLLGLALSGVVLYVNWQVFVLAVLGGDVVQGALGYFINPVFTVLLGVIFLRERARPAQWVAIGVSVVAIVVLVVGYGSVPWIALILTASFGTYGLIKNRLGPRVDAVSGLTVETTWLVPVAIVQLAVVGATSGLVFGTHGPVQLIATLLSGVATGAPLLLFSAAARRLPLVSLGLTQYLTPVLQFLFGVLWLHEAMPTERWVGFALVWVALIVLAVDLVVAARRRGPHALPASAETA
jgi:chloramphenicol-sensitive protein RarD